MGVYACGLHVTCLVIMCVVFFVRAHFPDMRECIIAALCFGVHSVLFVEGVSSLVCGYDMVMMLLACESELVCSTSLVCVCF